MWFIYILLILIMLIIIKRMIMIVPRDSICILEKQMKYYKTLRPGFHIISPFVSARVVPVEKRQGVQLSNDIRFGDSSTGSVTVAPTFLLWDPYTPFFTFEKLDEQMSNKVLEELSKIASGYTKEEFKKNLDEVKQRCILALNDFGKEYGIEFVHIDISL